MAGIEKFINGRHYQFEVATSPMAWVFVSYRDEKNAKRRVLKTDFADPSRLADREDIQINPHGVVLFYDRRLAEHFVSTMGQKGGEHGGNDQGRV